MSDDATKRLSILVAKLAGQVVELADRQKLIEQRLSTLEGHVRNPARPPKERLSPEERLARRRALIAENGKFRWPKKKQKQAHVIKAIEDAAPAVKKKKRRKKSST